MKCFFLITGILMVFSCNQPSQKLDNIKIVKGAEGRLLDSLLTPYVKELRRLTDNKAGLTIGVTKGDDIIYAHAFGYANIARGERANLNTVFHIASLSKPFTAAAIAKLIQQDKLNLEDKIVAFIPEFKMKGVGYDAISVKHILTHTSGIPANISPDDWTKPSYGSNALDENLEAIQKHTLDFEPGSKFSYSNSAFDILGIVISRASGIEFSEYIAKEILQPIGMSESTFKKPKDSLPDNYANSYSYGLETQEWLPYPYNEKLFPSSGMLTSLLDMCKWAQLHQGMGTVNDIKVLDEEYFNLIVKPQYDTPWGDHIGLSWFLQSYLERPIIMHTGQDTGFEAIIYTYPNENISIVVMANRDFSRTGRIINATSEVLFKEELKPYTISAKYQFAKSYKEEGVEKAIAVWQNIKKDTIDIFFSDNEGILTTGAILENGKQWSETKDVLEFYNSLDNESTYAWRLLGNANLKLGDTVAALACYQQCLVINPNYEKATIAIEQVSGYPNN